MQSKCTPPDSVSLEQAECLLSPWSSGVQVWRLGWMQMKMCQLHKNI